MKRLETLQPQLKVGQFDKKDQTYTVKETNEVLTLNPQSFSFLQFCNGTNSIKEICMLVHAREASFSFIDLKTQLEKWSEAKLFKNSADILAALRKGSDLSAGPQTPVKELNSAELLLALRKVSMFSNFSEVALKHIMAVSIQQKAVKGQTIIKKGNAAEEAYVLLSGSVGVFLTAIVTGRELPVATLPPLSVFGESAALSNQKRTADVIALSDSQLLRIPISQINSPELSGSLSKNLRLRLIFSQMIKTHPLFVRLPSDVIQLLLSGCRVEKVEAQKTVIQQGDEGQDFYFILYGSVLIVKDRLPEAHLGPGHYFGEMGGLLKQKRSASVVTEKECVFLILSIKNFISILASNLNLAVEIENMIQQRREKPQEVFEQTETEDITITEEITLEISTNLSDIENFDFSAPSQAEDTV